MVSGSGYIDVWATDITQSGDVLLGGGYKNGSVDFDPDTSSSQIRNRALNMHKGFLLRLDSLGDYKDLTVMQGTGESFFMDIVTLDTGGFLTAGVYKGTVDIDPGPATSHMLNQNGFIDGYYYQEFDSGHNLVWSTNHSTELPGWPNVFNETRILIDSLGDIYMTGQTWTKVFLEPSKNQGLTTSHSKSTYGNDYYLLKFNRQNDSVQWVYSPYEVRGATGSFARAAVLTKGRVYIYGRVVNQPVKFDGSNSASYGYQSGDKLYLIGLENCPIAPYLLVEDTTVCNSFSWADDTTLTSAGTYKLDKTIPTSYGCDSVLYTLNVTVQKSDMPQVSQYWWGLEIPASPRHQYIQWYDCSGDSILPGDTTETFLPEQDGSYALIYSDTSGCIDTSQCFTFSDIGLAEYQQEALNLFPNPVENTLHLEWDKMDLKKIRILGMQGRLLMTFSSQKSIDVSHLKPGAYLIQIETKQGVSLRKFMKR